MKTVWKTACRSIRTFFGRYMALLLIVAISVGFFAGLKITTPSMLQTGEHYLKKQKFYDYRLLSTLGFTEEDVEAFSALDGVAAAQGSSSMQVLMELHGGQQVFTLLSIPTRVNIPSLQAGRMPHSPHECLADADRFGPEDIGKTISLASSNSGETNNQLQNHSFTIVGLAESPLYMGVDRGSANLGNGAVYAFLYLPEEAFTNEVYTELTLLWQGSEQLGLYSDVYDDLIAENQDAVAALCKERADNRYHALLDSLHLTPPLAEQLGLKAPTTYVLTRAENAGYLSFKNDTAIVGGIANIFPVFFILIALLVCMTTMTRMVDEERTQIGVLKAMGMGTGQILAKYLLYAGSATLLGWASGFFLCTWGLPQIFWLAYGALYDFAPLSYLFRTDLAVLTLLVSLFAILGATLLSCKKELACVPAQLIRPRAAKSGKRILLERVTPLWKRLPFLQKIIARNMFLYKRKLLMMLIGIGCCAGLLVTAFGVRDSIFCISTKQYEQIQTYDIETSFAEGEEETVCAGLAGQEGIASYLTLAMHRVDLCREGGRVNAVKMMVFDHEQEDHLLDFWFFAQKGEVVPLPGEGEALVNQKVAEQLGLAVGDTLTIQNAERQTCTVRVSGIFENYVYNYVVLGAPTYAKAFGEYHANTALVTVTEAEEAVAGRLTGLPGIDSITRLSVGRETIDNALFCLHYIVLMVVGFSGALAFIVIFNLTNINIAERSREIATVQVLGFYPQETNRYVLRENWLLSAVAGLLGLPLGVLFHRVVMSMIAVDSFSFDVHIATGSYLLAFCCTVLFAVTVNLFMHRQIKKVKMAESLKAVE